MRIEAPPTTGIIELDLWLKKLWQRIVGDHLFSEVAWNAAEIADGDAESKEVTVTGAELGDQALASLSIDIADLVLDAQVTAADTVTCVLANNTGGAINLAAATVYVRVLKNLIE
jgi:hypothetical protein